MWSCDLAFTLHVPISLYKSKDYQAITLGQSSLNRGEIVAANGLCKGICKSRLFLDYVSTGHQVTGIRVVFPDHYHFISWWVGRKICRNWFYSNWGLSWDSEHLYIKHYLPFTLKKPGTPVGPLAPRSKLQMYHHFHKDLGNPLFPALKVLEEFLRSLQWVFKNSCFWGNNDQGNRQLPKLHSRSPCGQCCI